jgi:hypothetical protein
MALVCLALLFVLKERLLAQDDIPLLSARDVIELLNCLTSTFLAAIAILMKYCAPCMPAMINGPRQRNLIENNPGRTA